MVQDVLEFAARKLAEGWKVALVTVTETQGSSPASPGQMMAVLADGTQEGTAGGGATEHLLAQRAVEAIRSGERVSPFSFDHAQEGMVCGGGMSGLINVLGAGMRLVLFGGGHVAQSIAPIAVSAGFAVTIVEDREELSAQFADVSYLVCGPDEYGEKIPVDPEDYAVICTRGHRTDDDALRFCLQKPFRYIGMIGSMKKVASLFDMLRAEGAREEELARVYAPIGLDIASGSPQEIAISVMAELLLVKNNGTLTHKKDRRNG